MSLPRDLLDACRENGVPYEDLVEVLAAVDGSPTGVGVIFDQRRRIW